MPEATPSPYHFPGSCNSSNCWNASYSGKWQTMATPKNIELFNQLVGLIFTDLYEHFPIPIGTLDALRYAEAFGIEVKVHNGERYIDNDVIPESDTKLYKLFQATKAWLYDEGFITGDNSNARDLRWAVLTSKALLALNMMPTSLERSLGEGLKEALKEAGTEAGKAAIGEAVGRIFGATVSGFFGGVAS